MKTLHTLVGYTKGKNVKKKNKFKFVNEAIGNIEFWKTKGLSNPFS